MGGVDYDSKGGVGRASDQPPGARRTASDDGGIDGGRARLDYLYKRDSKPKAKRGKVKLQRSGKEKKRKQPSVGGRRTGLWTGSIAGNGDWEYGNGMTETETSKQSSDQAIKSASN
jgi:hypothetical protein